MGKLTITAAQWRALEEKRKASRSLYRRGSRESRTVDGIVFDSKAEATRYGELKLLRAHKRVWNFWRQPVFDLAGVVYRPDFLVLWREPQGIRVAVEEVKGTFRGAFREQALRTFRRNAEQVRQIYGMTVELVER